jgi:hypothetical protein
MTTTADKLIQFAKSNKIKKDEWMEAIEHLYAMQVDLELEESCNDALEHTVVMNGSKVIIYSTRELLN